MIDEIKLKRWAEILHQFFDRTLPVNQSVDDVLYSSVGD